MSYNNNKMELTRKETKQLIEILKVVKKDIESIKHDYMCMSVDERFNKEKLNLFKKYLMNSLDPNVEYLGGYTYIQNNYVNYKTLPPIWTSYDKGSRIIWLNYNLYALQTSYKQTSLINRIKRWIAKY